MKQLPLTKCKFWLVQVLPSFILNRFHPMCKTYHANVPSPLYTFIRIKKNADKQTERESKN